jgi:hypothetical protein
MSTQTKMSLRITAAIGLLFLAASGQFAFAQAPVQPNDVRKQLNQTSQPAETQAQPKTPTAAKPPAGKPATNNSAQSRPAQAASQTQAKTPVPATAKAQPGRPGVAAPVKAASTELSPAGASKAVALPAAQRKATGAVAVAQKATAPPQPERVSVARRDPFDPLIGKNKDTPAGPQAPLPAGKPGLMVASLQIDGIVKQSNSMIAIVSNPQMRVYFLREGDRLYDGEVEHITMEGVSFHETGKDAFGKPVERELTKRLYPTPGEQQ